MGFSGRSIRSGVAAAALFMFLSLTAAAQSPTPTAPPSTPAEQQTQPSPSTPPTDPDVTGDETLATIRTRTNEVNVVFTVTDKHGKRITNLKEGDFTVADDNKPPAQINRFRAEANLPLQVGLLID